MIGVIVSLFVLVDNALGTACASHTCSQVCGLANDGVSRQCFCNPGYQLSNDDVTCIGKTSMLMCLCYVIHTLEYVDMCCVDTIAD